MSIQNPSNNNQFTWINFYMELADKLLTFKNRRKELFDKLKTLDKDWIKFMLQNEKTLEWKFSDIDPFSVFAIINRSINVDKRVNIAKKFKDLFQLQSELPSDFMGIPVLDARRSCFFDFANESVDTDIDPLWDLFESAINDSKDDGFGKLLDKVVNQKEIGWKKITIALYWIRPYDYITLDSLTQAYLIANGIQISPKMTGKQYIDLTDTLQNDSNFMNKSFPEISLEAWYSKHVPNDDIDDEDNEEDQEPDSFIKAACDILRIKKNIILQGAPGTGKTYSTAAIALGLLGVKDVDFSDHPAVMKKYEEYRKEKGRIFFTTFHQSMDYEDFVEGLKPKIVKDNEGNSFVTYEVKPGIFKDVCKSAKGKNEEKEVDEPLNKEMDEVDPNRIVVTDKSRTIWKVSLGKRNEKNVFEKSDCFENNFIWVQGDDYPCDYFKNNMKIDDIVIVLSTRNEFDAIGIVTSDWYKCEGYDDVVKRDVKWLFKNVSYPYSDILKKGFENKQLPIEAAKHVKVEDLDLPKLQELIDKYTNNVGSDLKYLENKSVNSPVILIIDEINRGNVSKIFGELVTLLEADKRSGNGDHPITVTLPYSKEEFSVPSNVYIIGTMNTTDRSTGTLDYAVRRRFAFVTLKANPGLIQLDIAQKLFSNIEAFIEKYRPKDMEIDDLMVGHSYFMTEKVDELKLKIKYEVVPLLKEYCNDGLLTCSLDELNKRIEKWEELEVFNDSSVQTKDETDDDDEDQE